MPKPKRYWLMKSEAECYSIDDLARDKVTPWEGVRNFQARNFMKEMSVGDVVLFYHSNLKPSGVVGIGEVVTLAHADASAMRKNDEHFDPRSTQEKPIWECVDVAFVRKLPRLVGLDEIKLHPKLRSMEVARRGSRLSISEVTAAQCDTIEALANRT
jgi:predicted RNA-binding protein with PUA-like domain